MSTTASDDYTQSTDVQYTFTPGTTRLDIPVPVVNDNQFEATEDFQGFLSTDAAVAIIDVPTTTVEIIDNDRKWHINFSACPCKSMTGKSPLL